MALGVLYQLGQQNYKGEFDMRYDFGKINSDSFETKKKTAIYQ